MKITRTKFYQAVSIWNGTKFQLVTHLNTENPEVAGDLELEIVPAVGLKVHANGKTTTITMNNIAFIVEEPDDKPVKIKASKGA